MRTCSYVGFTDGLDIEKLTQTFRRIYKTPQECEDISVLLDFTLILALSSCPYEEYDTKSKQFINDTLDHIDSFYQGYKTLEQ